MEYEKLGNSNLNVSRICMGCMGFGDASNGMHKWTLDYNSSFEIIKEGLKAGINFFDTAISYQNGTSEMYVGKALNNLVKRENVIVATKFLPRTKEDIKNNVSGQKHIENSLDKSLKNLGMDYIDLYIYHMWDYNTPILEIMDGLNNAVKSGKVRNIGISNCFAYQIAKANALCEKEGFEKFVSSQGHYNLIFREEEREMIPYCKEENISLTPYSALASGRLSKSPNESSKRLLMDDYAKLKYDNTIEKDSIIVKRVEEVAKNRGVSMTEVSISWLLTKVTSPIIGMTKLSHIEGATKSLDLKLTPDEIDYLEEMYVSHSLVGIMAQNKK